MLNLLIDNKNHDIVSKFEFVNNIHFEEFKRLSIEIYKGYSKENQSDIPVLSREKFIYGCSSDEVFYFMNDCTRSNISENSDDFPNDIKKWNDDDYENFEDIFSDEYYGIENSFLKDVKTLLDYLGMSYQSESYMAPIYKLNHNLCNYSIVEVW